MVYGLQSMLWWWQWWLGVASGVQSSNPDDPMTPSTGGNPIPLCLSVWWWWWQWFWWWWWWWWWCWWWWWWWWMRMTKIATCAMSDDDNNCNGDHLSISITMMTLWKSGKIFQKLKKRPLYGNWHSSATNTADDHWTSQIHWNFFCADVKLPHKSLQININILEV